jgi:hypothetical protein
MTAVGFSIASRATDVGYFLGAVIASPVWLSRMIATGKIKTDWRARFGFSEWKSMGYSDALLCALLTLRDLQGWTGAEVAAALDLPLATMKTRLHRARLRWMAAVREEVGDAAR